MAQSFFVSVEAELITAIDQAQPGDEIIVKDGTWTDVVFELTCEGSENNPIVIKSETPGGASLEQGSRVEFKKNYITFSGFKFANAPNVTENAVIFGDVVGCRLTNCLFDNWGPSGQLIDLHWVKVLGINNRIDHCTFKDFMHEGVTILVKPGVMDNGDGFGQHLIDHNFFNNKPDGGGNGYECIKVGDGDGSGDILNTIVEHNYFYHCDGETEMVSNKSWNNIYRYNTIYECSGTITLRWGRNCLVEGNYFIGHGKENSGGVRLTDKGHTVINNYFQELDGKNAKAAISVMSGYHDALGGDGGHAQTQDSKILNNTIIDCYESINFGYSDKDDTAEPVLRPANNTIANNLIVSSSNNPMIIEQTEVGDPEDNIWLNNIVYGQDPGYDPAGNHINQDPNLTKQDDSDYYRLSANSIAIDAAVNIVGVSMDYDFEDQARDNDNDIGADEYSTAQAGHIVPVRIGDVGVSWVDDNSNDSVNSDWIQYASNVLPENDSSGHIVEKNIVLNSSIAKNTIWTDDYGNDLWKARADVTSNDEIWYKWYPSYIDMNNINEVPAPMTVATKFKWLDNSFDFGPDLEIRGHNKVRATLIKDGNGDYFIEVIDSDADAYYPLPSSFDPTEWHVLRLTENNGTWSVYLDEDNSAFASGNCGYPLTDRHIALFGLYSVNATSGVLTSWMGMIDNAAASPGEKPLPEGVFEEEVLNVDWQEYYSNVLPENDSSGHIVEKNIVLNSSIAKNTIWTDDYGNDLWKARADVTSNDEISYKWYPSYIDMNNINEVPAPMTVATKFKWLDNSFDFGPDLEIRGHNKVRATLIKDGNGDYFIEVIDSYVDASYPLPSSFDPTEWHVLRLTENNGTWSVYLDEDNSAFASGSCGYPLTGRHIALFGLYSVNATSGVLTSWMGMIDNAAASPVEKPLPEGDFNVNKSRSVTGLTAKGAVLKLNVYPNPVNEKLTVELDGSIKNADYNIFNMMGQFIQGGIINSSQTIEVSELSTGMYVIMVNCVDGVASKSFIVE